MMGMRVTMMKSDWFEVIDFGQRQKAIDPQRSFVVQAPAGSGKTELLMQRYLNLLSHVERPEEVLALTFTRKAAGELQNRILKAMSDAYQGMRGTSAHEKKTLELAAKALEQDRLKGWRLLENPGRLKVQTIDSFCSYLVRQMPLLSGMGGHPSMAKDAAELYAEAAMRTIEMVEDDSEEGECVRSALKHLDNSAVALRKRLVDMLGRRDQWLRHVQTGASDLELRSLLEGSLERLVSSKLKGLKEGFPKDLLPIFLMACGYAAKNLESDANPVCALAGLKALPEDRAEDLALWKGVRKMLLTDKNTVRATVTVKNGFPTKGPKDAKWMKDEFIALLGTIESAEGFVSSLATVADLPHPAFDDEQWKALSSIVRLLPLAERCLTDVMADLGQSDFQSIAMGAIKSLGDDDDPTDLMLALDMKYSHILVDEYQDTSRVQLDLLKGLTRGWSHNDGRTLFIVGDPMQSIYLFREADVGLFIEARDKGIARKNGIGDLKLDPIRLEANFRSQKNVVDWVNTIFPGTFSPEEDPFRGAVSYAPSVAAKQAIDGVYPQVRLFGKKDDEAEAAEVVSLIKTMPKGESVAVLCRSRTHLASIVPALKKAGIGFRAVEIDKLENRPVVQDLFSLTRALSHPFDRVAWLAILRAPWCGLSLSDLLVIASAGRGQSVLSLMHDEARLSLLSSDGSKRLLRVRDIISKATARRGRADLRGLVEGLWIELGGPACVSDDEAMKDAEAFLSLLEEAASSGQEDIVARVETRLGRLYATHSGGASIDLDLMTIHKAKGLEYDHVILPGLGKKARGDESRLMRWMEWGDDLLLAPIDKKGGSTDLICKLIKTVEKDRASLEMVRAFYVACTRAKKGLHLFGHVRGVEGAVLKIESASLLSTIVASLRPEMITAGPEAGSGEGEAVHGKTAPAPIYAPISINLQRLSVGWASPLPAPALETEASSDEVHQEKEPEFYWAGHLVKHLGTVVHRYMCNIARQTISAWSGEKVDSERANINGMLRTLGLNRDEALDADLRAVGIIKGALADEKGRWILGTHEEAEVELPITSVIDGSVVRSILDRTFVSGGVRWIVDYKTSLHEGGAKEEFLENEKTRYAAQLERYEKALRLSGEKREIRKGLYYPALGAWIEW